MNDEQDLTATVRTESLLVLGYLRDLIGINRADLTSPNAEAIIQAGIQRVAEKLERENNQLRTQLTSLNQKNSELESECQNHVEHFALLKQDNNKLRAELKLKNNDCELTLEACGNFQTTIDELRTKLSDEKLILHSKNETMNTFTVQIKQLKQQLAAAKAKCEGLEKDKARLDWLEGHHFTSGGVAQETTFFVDITSAPDVRSAITAAMKQTT